MSVTHPGSNENDLPAAPCLVETYFLPDTPNLLKSLYLFGCRLRALHASK